MCKLNKLRQKIEPYKSHRKEWTNVSLWMRQKVQSIRKHQTGQWCLQCLTAPSRQSFEFFHTSHQPALHPGFWSWHGNGSIQEGKRAQVSPALRSGLGLLQEHLWATQAHMHLGTYMPTGMNGNLGLCSRALLLCQCHLVCAAVLGFFRRQGRMFSLSLFCAAQIILCRSNN